MLPILRQEKTKSKKYIVDFKGLNLGEGWQDGELADSKNISSVLYPCVTQRYARVIEEFEQDTIKDLPADTLDNKGGLVLVKAPYILHNGSVTDGGLGNERKQIAVVGDLILFFPDKRWYNAVTKETGAMELAVTVRGAVFTDNAISASGVTFPFRVGDGVTITGCSQATDNNKNVIIRKIEDGKLIVGDNNLKAATEIGAVTITRAIPDMDVICESNNRLWGAKGGMIYASKYGDPLNFNYNDGTANDSYAIEVGTEGDFTAAHHYGTYVCFFKEHCLHKMYGTKPSNYQVTTTEIHGVQKGSERSLVNINDTLYYKGVNGVYAYGGGVPELISDAFGTVRFHDACASSDGDRYYISMRSAEGSHLMTYDVRRRIWLKEDGLFCTDMTYADGYVWLLSQTGDVYKVDPEADRSEMHWSITLCPFNETMFDRKGYSKFMVRADLAAGAWLKLEYRCDHEPLWREAFSVTHPKAKTINYPVLPERCDCVQIRISGKGECLLRTFAREFYMGSDV